MVPLSWSPLWGTTTTSPQAKRSAFMGRGALRQRNIVMGNRVGDEVAYFSLTPFFANTGAASSHRGAKTISYKGKTLVSLAVFSAI